MKYLKKYSGHFFFLLLGIFLASGINLALAHGGNTNLIHGCVGTGILNNGRLRIIAAGGTCNGNETPLDWNQLGDPGYGGLLVDNLDNTDLNHIDFRHRDLNGINFTNTNLSNSNLRDANMSNTNLTSTIFIDAFLDRVNFTNANFTSSNVAGAGVSGSNFTNVNFTNAELQSAMGFDDPATILTGVIWNNTICPDGTNSDSNGNTCQGHLTP